MKCSRTIIAVGAVAVLLIGISVDDCLAETQTPPPPKRFQMLLPIRYKCLDLLELEKIRVNPQTNTITTNDPELAADYRTVAGWLQGWFTAWNFNSGTDGDVTKGTTTYQMMAWLFSYCRAHPSDHLVQAALELLNALNSTTRK